MASATVILNAPSAAGRFRLAAATTARFVLHFVEMLVAMVVGMMAFMAVPGVTQLPEALHLAGMAISMSLPMIVWMKVRGHAWRHGLEMSAAMLLPWAAVIVLVAVGVSEAMPWLAHAEGPAMLIGMLGYMLVRREHYAHGGQGQHGSAQRRLFSQRFSKLAAYAAYASAVVLLPLAVGVANLLPKVPAETLPPAPAFGGVLPDVAAPDPHKRTAVMLSSAYGAEITDILPPYELLARSGAFNVYSVAPERTALPLGGGDGKGATLDFVPQLSFAEYESKIGVAPDLIVIPYFPGYSPERDSVVVDWIRAHFGPNTTILSICSGGLTLADTGLLDGRTATTNTGIFDIVQRKAPTATLVRNVRYLDDGNIVTSEDLTTGIDATLHIVDRVAGRETALRVAREVGYSHTSALDDPRYEPKPRFGAVVANAAFTFRQERVGLLLFDGVSEFGLAGIIEPYGGSLVTPVLTMTPQRNAVVGASGFLFIPRRDFSANPDRVLLPPGSDASARQSSATGWSAAHPGRAAEDLYGPTGSGQAAYDVTLGDIERTRGAWLAQAVADTVLYPAEFPAAGWPAGTIGTLLALAALAAALVFGSRRLVLTGRRELSVGTA
ncbi:MAG TPA: DJ-1/PfpI family protein [Chloroflexota bacterium]|nr:DJ-1/PfpI family protein [Chloroflexota bacterium]